MEPERINLVVDACGGFSVVKTDRWGGRQAIYSGPQLEQVLLASAQQLGHPLVLPISGPNTEL